MFVFNTLAVSIVLAQQGNELFQCQPSSQGNEQIYSPNIPDAYFHHTNISESTTNLSMYRLVSISARYYVFRVGMLQADCTGTAMSVQYCYRGPRGLSMEEPKTIFQLGIGTLTDGIRSDPRFNPNTQFSLISIRSVPDGSKCASDREDNITCCDTTDITQFTYYNSNDDFAYVLGVNRSSDVQLLAFEEGLTQFNLNAYQVVNFGQQISLVGSFRVELGLPVLRFFIGIYMFIASCPGLSIFVRSLAILIVATFCL